MTPEGAIKNAICKILDHYKKLKCLDFWLTPSTGTYDPRKGIFRKQNSPYARLGVADISAISSAGRAIFIEVKADRGRLSENQKRFQEAVEEMNAIFIVAKSPKDVVDRLKLEGVL